MSYSKMGSTKEYEIIINEIDKNIKNIEKDLFISSSIDNIVILTSKIQILKKLLEDFKKSYENHMRS